MTIRFLIIDDHDAFRHWLGHHLTAEWDDSDVEFHEPVGAELTSSGFKRFTLGVLQIGHSQILSGHDGRRSMQPGRSSICSQIPWFSRASISFPADHAD